MKKIFYCLILGLFGFLGLFQRAWTEGTPSVLVQTQPLAQYTLSDQLSCYGTVIVNPEKVMSINFPRDGQITRLLVSPGERVKKGTPLLEFETSPQDSVGYAQAQSTVNFARQELTRMQHLAAEQLATRSQVAQAEKTLMDAEATLAVQKKLGTSTPIEIITAPFEGMVTALKAAQGDHLSAGTTALQFSRIDGLLVILGIEPEERPKIKPGTLVQVSSVFDGTLRGAGTVRKVHGLINPQTKLVDVTVMLKDHRASSLLPGMSVRGKIILRQHRGPAVPRQAILRDEKGSYIFVIRNNLAHRLTVKTGIESRGLVGISGSFRKNDRVVVLGNYELQDGMAVREAK